MEFDANTKYSTPENPSTNAHRMYFQQHSPAASSCTSYSSVPELRQPATSYQESSIPPGGPGRRTSRVWKYFVMMDNFRYVCQLCSFVGAYTNTTNMRKHIQYHHPERFQDILDHTLTKLPPHRSPYFGKHGSIRTEDLLVSPNFSPIPYLQQTQPLHLKGGYSEWGPKISAYNGLGYCDPQPVFVPPETASQLPSLMRMVGDTDASMSGKDCNPKTPVSPIRPLFASILDKGKPSPINDSYS